MLKVQDLLLIRKGAMRESSAAPIIFLTVDLTFSNIFNLIFAQQAQHNSRAHAVVGTVNY